MKAFPVGKLKEKNQNHPGILIHDLLADILRPFLEPWQADYRAGWKQLDRFKESWFDVQKACPKDKELLIEWTNLRKLMRKIEHQIRHEYKL